MYGVSVSMREITKCMKKGTGELKLAPRRFSSRIFLDYQLSDLITQSVAVSGC